MKRKLLATLLSLTMVLSLLPVTALADQTTTEDPAEGQTQTETSEDPTPTPDTTENPAAEQTQTPEASPASNEETSGSGGDTAAGSQNATGVAQVESVYFETLQAAIGQATPGATVTLLSDVTEDITVAAGKDLILDLNGKTLTGASGHTITNSGTLTINGGEGSAVKADTASHAALLNEVGAVATINGGTFSKTLNASSSDYYVIDNHGTLTISGGTFTSTSTHSSLVNNGWYSVEDVPSGASEAKLTIRSGSFSGGVYSIKNALCGDLSITNGTISLTRSGSYVICNYHKANISGGEITGMVCNQVDPESISVDNYTQYTAGELTISGGTFSNTYAIAGEYALVVKSGTAKITGGTFRAKQIALNVEGGEVTIDQASFTSSTNDAVLVNNGKVTIQGGSFTSMASSGDYSGIDVGSGNTLTPEVNISGGNFSANYGYTVRVYNGTANISGGTFTAKTKNAIGTKFGQVNISGGTFTVPADTNITAKFTDSENTGRDRPYPVITGGIFSNNNLVAQTIDGYTTEQITEAGQYQGYYRLVALTDTTAAASVTVNRITTRYSTLARALSAVGEDGTVTLLADATGAALSKSCTIDLNGHTLTGAVTGSAYTLTVKDSAETTKGTATLTAGSELGKLAVEDSAAVSVTSGTYGDMSVLDYLANNAEVTVKLNGDQTYERRWVIGDDNKTEAYQGRRGTVTLDLNGHTLTTQQITVGGSTTSLTVQDSGENGTLSNTDGYGIYVLLGATVTVKSGTIASLDSPLAGNNTTGDMNFIIQGGTLTATRGPSIYMPGEVTLNISGGTLNGGVSLRMGQVTISGGTINATTGSIDAPSNSYWKSSNEWLPDALYVFGGTYTSTNGEYQNSLNLTITGGTFNCTNGQGSAIAIYDIGKVSQAMDVTISGGTFKTTTTGRNAYDILSLENIGVTNPAEGYGNEAYVGNVKTSITGGTFSTKPAAKYLADGYYAAAIQGGTYQVKEKTAPTVDAPTANTLTYTGTAQALVTAGSAEGGTVSYRLGDSGEYTATVPTATAAGDYTVWYKVTGDDNHENTAPASVTVTIAKAALTVTANANTITYGDAPANAGVSYSGFVNDEGESALGGTLSYTYDYTQYGKVGSYTIIPAGLTSDNYAITFQTGALTVSQKEVGLTWNNASGRVYGDGKTVTATATGLVNRDSIDVTVTGGAQTAAGTGYTATATTLTGARAGNYTLPAEPTTTYDIAKAAPAVTAPTAIDELTYTGGAQTLVAAGSAEGGTMSYRLGDSGEYTATVPTATAAGDYTVWYKVTEDDNHENTAPASVTVTIAKAAPTLTITPSSTTLYGDGTVTLTVAATDEGADNVAVTGGVTPTRNSDGTWSVSLPNTTASYTFTASYPASANYLAGSATCTVSVNYYDYSESVTTTTTVEVAADATTVTNVDGSTTTTETTTTTDRTTGAVTETTTATTTAADGATTESKVETTTAKDGTVTETTTEKTTAADGATTESEVETVTATDGTVTETATEKTTAADGAVTESEVKTVTATDGSVTETATSKTTKADGAVTETKSETVTAADGAKTETKRESVVAADGATKETTKETQTTAEGVTTSTETVKTATADGTTASKVTTVDETGTTVTKAEASISAQAVAAAAESGEAVTLPITVAAATKADSDTLAPTVALSVPEDVESVKVEIPVENVTAGTVVVLVHEDGTEEIVKLSTVTDGGVALNISGDVTVKLVDNSKDFEDTKDHWAEDAIDFATSRELFNGQGNGTFAPEGEMTRSMLVTVLARLDGVDTTTGSTWDEAGLNWAVENGISDGTNGDSSITREQLATMLYRYMGTPTADNALESFPDADQVSSYAAEAMNWAVSAGIIGGTGDGTLNPSGSASRAEVATMLQRFTGVLVK